MSRRKTVYSSSLSTEVTLHDQREVVDWGKQMDDNDYFPQIKNVAASESANSTSIQKVIKDGMMKKR